MGAAEAVKNRLARARKGNQNFAMVGFSMGAPEEAAGAQAVDQFDGAVMPDEQARGKLADDGPRAFGQAGDGQQKLMLAGLEAVRAGLLLAEVQEPVDLEAEIRQQPEVGLGEGFYCAHKYIVARYIWPGGWPHC